MKSIKTNPKSATGPIKGKIVLHIIDNIWVGLIIFFSKKTDMKFIILISNLKEISPRVFSWKKKNI